MFKTFCSFLLCFAIAVLDGLSASANEKYQIIIERKTGNPGSLKLVENGKSLRETECWEDDNLNVRVTAKKYVFCSATTTSRGKKKAIYLPNEQTGRKGIFIRGKTDSNPKGAIFVSEMAMEKIYDAIKPKNDKNVSVIIRSAKVAKAMENVRAIIKKSKTELETAIANNDSNSKLEAEKQLTFFQNLYRLMELGETKAITEEMVTKDAFLSELTKKGTDFLKKAALKAALKTIAKKAGGKLLGGAVGILVDLGAADDVSRDPNEILRDSNASEAEVAQAIKVTLGIERNKLNSSAHDSSLQLIIKRFE